MRRVFLQPTLKVSKDIFGHSKGIMPLIRNSQFAKELSELLFEVMKFACVLVKTWITSDNSGSQLQTWANQGSK